MVHRELFTVIKFCTELLVTGVLQVYSSGLNDTGLCLECFYYNLFFIIFQFDHISNLQLKYLDQLL